MRLDATPSRVYSNRVEDDPAADRPPDPEQLAGQEIRRLREARGWSQQETARRMEPFGYRWHQTMIAKIESGTRPLRVNELTDFAALFDVAPAALLMPWSRMPLEEVEARIAELEPALEEAQALADKASSASREALNIEARLGLLRQRRDYLTKGRGGVQA
jgi:transcriptional regulator with XRE-family HTH domain